MKIKVGDKIRIVNMAGEKWYNGREGVVEKIDGMGQLHGSWGGLAVIPSIDEIEVIGGKNEKKAIKILKEWLVL